MSLVVSGRVGVRRWDQKGDRVVSKHGRKHSRWTRTFSIVSRSLTRAWRFVSRENIPRLAFLMLCLMALVGVVALMVERRTPGSQITSFGRALYWAMITMSTVGYGDIVPKTTLGRVVTGVLVFSGMGLISLFTATIASVLTAKRIRKGMGLEQIKVTNHIVICGWNRNGEKIMDGLRQSEVEKEHDVVLVNTQPEEKVDEVLSAYRDLNLKYVRGDFVQENVLNRANLGQAYTAVVLAEGANPDDRTIRGVLAIKSIKPEIKVCVEILDPENEEHLRRLDVEDIIIRGEYSGFLLASAATAPGITQVARELLSYDAGNEIWRSDIPSECIGRPFEELASYFRKQHGALLIGVIVEEKGLPVEDMVGDDSSPIDAFIKRKFLEAGRDLLAESSKRSRVVLNPEEGYEIGEDDRAIVIATGPIQI